MSDKPPKVAGRRYVNEHDRDLYESDLMYERWLAGQPQPSGRSDEGYDVELDNPNGYVGADERERDAKGEV